MDNQRYLVIIGDMIGSRAIKNRNAIQIKLRDALETINDVYAQAIASKFIITLGDEFQGVLHSGFESMEIIQRVQQTMESVRFRFGIGVGSLSTPLSPDISIGADGKAFHLAREMISQVKMQEGKKATPKTDILIGIEGHEGTGPLLNTICSLCWAIRKSWTDRQREVFATLQIYGGTQGEIAKRLGITQSSVQKSLANSQYYTYKKAVDQVAQELGILMEDARKHQGPLPS